jgi:hypothetical protein
MLSIMKMVIYLVETAVSNMFIVCNALLGAMTRLEWVTKMWLAKITSGNVFKREP